MNECPRRIDLGGKANDTSGRSFTIWVASQALKGHAAPVLAGCLAISSCGMPLTLESRYAGALQGCAGGSATRATLVRQANHFSFAPSDGALVISGTVAADGSFSGALVTSPSRHDQEGRSGTAAQAFALTVTGHLDGGAATGTYATPRCHAAFYLPRADTAPAP